MQIFAYGSNMHTARLRARVSSAVPLGVGMVAGRRFEFHKRGRDGSGKADAFHTGDDADFVWGVLFEIAAAEKPLLDECESRGVGYDDVRVDVQLTCGESTDALIYVARTEMIDVSLRPFCWYHGYVVAGAREHGLPQDYADQLAKMLPIRDPDDARRRHNWGVAGGASGSW